MSKDKGFAIINKGRREATGVMRGRDVRLKLATRNVDPELRTILETIAEINHTNTLAIAELATMFDQMVNVMQGMTDIAQNMKDRTDKMSRAMQDEIAGEEGAKDTVN